MARIKRIQQRLENWALWRVRQNSNGLGFASSSILLRDAWSQGSYDGVVIPVLEIEAAETDQAIEALKLGKGHLHMTLHLYYIDGLGIRGVAANMGRAESTIKAQLDQADLAIDRWLDEQVNIRERAKVAAACNEKRSFPS